jgi:cytochrome c5
MIRILVAVGAAILTWSALGMASTIEERIKPEGSLCMAGEACADASVAASAGGASGEPRSGETVYTTKCSSCHATGAAGAPKLGDAAAWTDRIGKGDDVLYANAINGYNAMPAKGLCFDCSDDEIKAAVDHMVSLSK